MSKPKPYEGQVWREPDGKFSMFVWLPGRASVEIEAPTWRALRVTARSLNLDLGKLRESEVKDGLGVLERALR